MRTAFQTPEKYAAAALRFAKETMAVGKRKPEHFLKIMRENRGTVQMYSPSGRTSDGLEPKNPVIVALGDSVTAGHFEYTSDPAELFAKVDQGLLEEDEAIEITDARECYLEKFRSRLIDLFEQTSVSVINSGIAGDTIYGMQKRLYRDVIRYQPDLVIINGALNWSAECGEIEEYRRTLREVVCLVKRETKADLVLLTPNMEIPPSFIPRVNCSLLERVEAIRNTAESEDVCLADAYKVWEAYKDAGFPIKELLANGMNHPSVTGHEMYAEVLMQLIEK